MAKLLALHPLGQIFAFFCGLLALLIITTRKKSSIALHINFGLLYYLMAALGFAIGVMMYSHSGRNYMPLWINIHQIIAVIVMILFGIGAGTGFLLLKKGRELSNILRLHRFSNYLSMFSFVIQGIIGMRLFLNLQ
jgi:glucan phosphoethanolaminetransferase (alkaline phosphatase superfamily)